MIEIRMEGEPPAHLIDGLQTAKAVVFDGRLFVGRAETEEETRARIEAARLACRDPEQR